MSRTTVSLVIPSRRGILAGELLAAVEAQTRPPLEILCIHDAELRGPAWARNQGVARARGDYVAFLDDDCIPPEDWLERLVATAERFDADVVGGTYDEASRLLADRRERAHRYPTRDGRDEAGLVGAGGNIMFRRSVLDACRERDGFVFDETFRLSQDWELTIRCRSLGASFAFCTARVRHLKQVSRISYLRHQFTRGLGIAALHEHLKRNPSLSPPHRSLLWPRNAGGRDRAARWLVIFGRKLLGPFDVGSFRSKGDFAAFWLGEKAQGLGFVWGRLRHGRTGASPAGEGCE
jgi:hypothetical protein